MQLDPITVEKLAPMWFEVVLTGAGWASLYVGPQRGGRRVEQPLLRDVVIDEHPRKQWHYDGVNHANQGRYHRRDDR